MLQLVHGVNLMIVLLRVVEAIKLAQEHVLVKDAMMWPLLIQENAILNAVQVNIY